MCLPGSHDRSSALISQNDPHVAVIAPEPDTAADNGPAGHSGREVLAPDQPSEWFRDKCME